MAASSGSLSCFNKIEFKRSLECQYGLWDHLLKNGCLTEEVINDLKQRYSTELERNNALIRCINASNIKKFEQGLEETNQRHLANFIRRNGIRSSPDEEWPLSRSHVKPIDKCFVVFVTDIQPAGLTDYLLAEKCISSEHKSSILSKNIDENKNRELLDIMKRRSIQQLTKFKLCLELSEHPSHLLEMLTKETENLKISEGIDDAYDFEVVHHQNSDFGQFIGSRTHPTEINIGGVNIRGVTVLNNEIFVLQDARKEIKVYNAQNMSEKQDIIVRDMVWPFGIVGCAYNSSLYIIDSNRKCVHKINLRNRHNPIISNWPLGGDYWPWGITMFQDRILITIQVNDGFSRVVEYNMDGQKLREIAFESSIKYATQTVQTAHNQFIVSHGYKDTLHRVCVVDAKGLIIWAYGGGRGGGQGRLNAPKSLAVDSYSQQIFVADRHNNRIVLLDTNLDQLELNIPNEVSAPIRLHFDSATDRLFIGEKYGRLLVIGFRK